MTQELKPRELQALNYILSHTSEHGYAPTVREIANGIGCNTSSAQWIIVRLVEKGAIEKAPHTNRTITVKRAS